MKQRFKPDQRVLRLMELFRRMVNDCIRIGLAEGRMSLKSLSLTCYPELRSYQTPSAYRLCAISKATGILTSYKKLSKTHHVKQPDRTRLSLITCYGVKTIDGRIRLPGNVEIPLNSYVQRFLSQPGVELRSVNLTPDSLNISVRRQVQSKACAGMLGIDTNLDNVTVADTENQVESYDLSKTTAVKSQCRWTKRRFSRNDAKIRKHIFSKYGRLERNRCRLVAAQRFRKHRPPSQNEEASHRHGGSARHQEIVPAGEWARWRVIVEG